MPVDSIITTIITRVMVRMRTGLKMGAAISKGSTRSNHWALATFSNDIIPMPTATTAPMMMPSSTEILAMKPLPNLAISRMDSSTRPEMPTPVRSA